MAWDLVGVRRENKEEADELREQAKLSSGREPTFDEIFRRGLEDLKNDMELEVERERKKRKSEEDVLDLFK
jgi:hypothetical protein